MSLMYLFNLSLRTLHLYISTSSFCWLPVYFSPAPLTDCATFSSSSENPVFISFFHMQSDTDLVYKCLYGSLFLFLSACISVPAAFPVLPRLCSNTNVHVRQLLRALKVKLGLNVNTPVCICVSLVFVWEKGLQFGLHSYIRPPLVSPWCS